MQPVKIAATFHIDVIARSKALDFGGIEVNLRRSGETQDVTKRQRPRDFPDRCKRLCGLADIGPEIACLEAQSPKFALQRTNLETDSVLGELVLHPHDHESLEVART